MEMTFTGDEFLDSTGCHSGHGVWSGVQADRGVYLFVVYFAESEQ
jgi:hypothetical protein